MQKQATVNNALTGDTYMSIETAKGRKKETRKKEGEREGRKRECPHSWRGGVLPAQWDSELVCWTWG